MNQYVEHKGVLLNRYEWNGGMGMGHKEVSSAQAARKREVKKGFAKLVKGF